MKLILGDCLEAMADMNDDSIDLIVIDPPYNIKKADWDKWNSIDSYVEFMGKVFSECERLLKNNGSFYFFHNDFLQIVELQNWLNKNSSFVFKQLITINKKERSHIIGMYGSRKIFRNFINMAEYCLFYTFQDKSLEKSFVFYLDYMSEEKTKA